MVDQPGLFDKSTDSDGQERFRVPARRGHETQQAGAEAASANAGNQSKRVLRALALHDDLTDRETAAWTSLELSVVNARRNELEFPSGPSDGPAKVRRTRKRNHKFSGVRVWAFAITDAGRSVL